MLRDDCFTTMKDYLVYAFQVGSSRLGVGLENDAQKSKNIKTAFSSML